jgi:hypothetical protein
MFELTQKLKFFSNASKHNPDAFANLQEYIKHNIPPVKPQYTYDKESGINPAYQNISQFKQRQFLLHNEKRIWVLRSDFILATGVKNAYQQEYGYNGLADTFDESLHPFLNWENRYGHPSLALAEDEYDGFAYYAGFLCQRTNFLQVYLSSGRFERKDLSAEQTHRLECYIAALFQDTYGVQDIVFEYGIPGDRAYLSVFFGEGIFSPENPRRCYTYESIKNTLQMIEADKLSLEHDQNTISG